MEKPAGYDEAQALTGEYETLEAGGYICEIKRAKEETSKSGKKMLVLAFDIIEGEHAGYYQRRYDDLVKTNPEAKWNGVYRQMLEGDKAAGYLKGLITSLESSNPGFNWEKCGWDENKLVGLKFGGLFGKEEYENQISGERKMTTKIRFIRTVEAVKSGKFEIPKDKMLPAKGDAFEGFTSNTNTNDDDLPF